VAADFIVVETGGKWERSNHFGTSFLCHSQSHHLHRHR
jgi:hypothetical protein